MLLLLSLLIFLLHGLHRKLSSLTAATCWGCFNICHFIRCLVKPAMPETTALGAAMAAGAAEGVNVWDLSAANVPDSTSTTYHPQINPEGEDVGQDGWKGEATWLQVKFYR